METKLDRTERVASGEREFATRNFIAGLAGFAIAFAACATALAASRPEFEQPLPFWRLDRAPHAWGPGGMMEPEEIVVRDQKAFARVWKRLNAGMQSAAALPRIDFSHEMVIVIAVGARGNGGTKIQGEQVIAFPGLVRVRYTVVEPGMKCMTTQSFTAPVSVLRTNRRDTPAMFGHDTIVQECN